ncbi:MAG: hypothetical protein ACI4J0_12380 [Huintestinicola sp.]|uniref:hypothetical protein n=1 Tax=Huintestinicola sp. TaxID=2981661 RepID=UPI003F11D8E1
MVNYYYDCGNGEREPFHLRAEVIAETAKNRYTDDSVQEYVYCKYRVCAYVNGQKGKYSDVVETGYFDYPD